MHRISGWLDIRPDNPAFFLYSARYQIWISVKVKKGNFRKIFVYLTDFRRPLNFERKNPAGYPVFGLTGYPVGYPVSGF
jgi:hypothetical protein